MRTYRFDSNKVSHRNSADSDQRNIHSVADRSIVTSAPDPLEVCPEIDLKFATASQTLNH